MISHSLNAIYFHIGKTAGTSVEKLLDDTKRDHTIADYDVFFGYDKKHHFYLQHATAEFIRNNVSDEIFKNYYKFSIVRNPYERLVSVYHYLIDQHTARFGSFEKYIHSLSELTRESPVKNGSHHIAQTCYTHIEGELVCDDVVHFELLPDAFDPVQRKLNLSKKLEKHNTGRWYKWQVKPVSDYFTAEMIDIVSTLFKKDFDHFGYSLDPGQRLPISQTS